MIILKPLNNESLTCLECSGQDLKLIQFEADSDDGDQTFWVCEPCLKKALVALQVTR